jgi:quercetin dioxygenase-like cupin family protein
MTGIEKTKPLAKPAVANYSDGEAIWWFGTLAVLLLTGEQTNGGLTIIDVTMAPGGMAPPHVHHREEESFWVREGSVTFQIGEEEIAAEVGDIVVGPRDVPHRFKAGPAGARLWFLLTPAGLEGLVREQGAPAEALTLPPPGGTPPDLEKAREIARRYGCELLV